MKLIKIESNPDVYVNADVIREIWQAGNDHVGVRFTDGTWVNYATPLDKVLKLLKAAK